jgi:hypothetical protein
MHTRSVAVAHSAKNQAQIVSITAARGEIIDTPLDLRTVLRAKTSTFPGALCFFGQALVTHELDNEQLDTAQLAVDTHGYTDFAMLHARLLGFDLCPRLKL